MFTFRKFINMAQDLDRNELWDREQTLLLIELWSAQPSLYDIDSKEHGNRYLRHKVCNQFAAMLGKTVPEIKKKMKHLRMQYIREEKRVEMTKKEASNPNEVYHSKWPYYKPLHFLNKCIRISSDIPHGSSQPRTSNSFVAGRFSAQIHENGGCHMLGAQDSEELVVHPDTAQITKQEEPSATESDGTESISEGFPRDNSHVVNGSHHVLERNVIHNADDAFGKMVAAELKMITDRNINQLTKLKIQQLLYEAHTGNIGIYSSQSGF